MKQWEEVEVPRGMGLVCSYKDCKGKVLVNPDKMKGERAGRLWKTSPCPYCFRVQLLPGEDAPNGMTGVAHEDIA